MKEIRVEVFGQAYQLHGELDPAYLEGLARTVDAKMRLLAEQTGTLDTRRLAVLAALNLADELSQLKEKFEQERGALPREFSARLEQCNRLLDSVLSSGPRG